MSEERSPLPSFQHNCEVTTEVSTIQRSKYNVAKDTERRTYDGIIFDSQMEMRYYRDVVLPLAKSGDIQYYELQKEYELQPKFVRDGQSVRAITYESAYDDIIDAQITLLEQAKSNIDANSTDALAIQAVIDNLETLKGLTVEDLYGSEQADAAKERYEDLENTISQISNAADILSDIRSGDGDPISILKDLIDIAQEYEDVDLSNFMSFGTDGIQFSETGIETWIDSVIDATEGLDLLEQSFPGITEWLKKNAKENIEAASTYDVLSDAISGLQSAAEIVQQIRDGEGSLEILSSIIDLAEKSGKDVTEFISGFDEINGVTYNIDALNAAMDESANGLAVLEEKFPGISAYLKEHATDIDETVSA